MTNRDHKLSLARQAELLGISRGSLSYEPRPASEDDLRLMRRIDALHMEYPFAGSRMMKGLLRQEGFTAGRLHVATCMKRMGIQALYRRPNTSKPAPGRKVFPYLLRKLAVARPNQFWAMDITYIPMARSFVYLVAVLDWSSRKVLAWRLSTTLENHAKGVQMLKSEAAPRQPWPTELIKDYRKAATGLALVVFELCLGTGQRIGDVLKMNWGTGVTDEDTAAVNGQSEAMVKHYTRFTRQKVRAIRAKEKRK